MGRGAVSYDAVNADGLWQMNKTLVMSHACIVPVTIKLTEMIMKTMGGFNVTIHHRKRGSVCPLKLFLD